MTIDHNFTATGVGPMLLVPHGESLTCSLSGTFVGTAVLERSTDGGLSWTPLVTAAAAATGTIKVELPDGGRAIFRWRCSAFTSGTLVTQIADVADVVNSFEDSKGVPQLQIVDGGIRIPNAAETPYALIEAIKGLTPAANKMFYFSGPTTAVIAALTAAGRALLDDADADAQLATLGGTSPGISLFKAANALAQRTAMACAEDPGRCAVNVLRVASNVAEAETVDIGGDTYEVEIVNTDSTDDSADGDFNSTSDPLDVEVDSTTYPNLYGTLAAGDLIRVENEIMRVDHVDGDHVFLIRGQSGTTAAAHADANDIYVGDGIVAGIAVGLVAVLTPAAFTAALVADVNGQGAEAVTAEKISDNEVLIYSDTPGAVTLACAETLAGANNEWAAAAMFGGAAQATRKFSVQTRVPTATEVALDQLHVVFDFTPSFVQAFVAPTATPGAYTAWDGAITISGGRVTLDNSGAVDWATTDNVVVIAWA